jgi:hypothetical protein
MICVNGKYDFYHVFSVFSGILIHSFILFNYGIFFAVIVKYIIIVNDYLYIYNYMNLLLKYSVFLFCSIFLVIALNSCGSNKKLQGRWNAAGNLGDSTDMHSWYIEYVFEGRNYRITGYPPLSEEGTYEVIEEKGDSLQLYFNVQKSSPETKSHKEWLICRDSVLVSGGITMRKTVQ